MPELPEVETVRTQLLKKVKGKVIADIKTLSAKQFSGPRNYKKALIGKTLSNISRRGKLLAFSFTKEPDLFLLVHLKMTGQLIFRSQIGQVSGGGHTITEGDEELPHKHTRIVITFADGSALYFNDLRKFGYMHLVNAQVMQAAFARFGPEPLDKDFDCSQIYQAVVKSTRVIKAILLDQSVIAGLGNIYVDEVLFRAQILPNRKGVDLTRAEVNRICKYSQAILHEAVLAGGTTFRNYVDTGGVQGNFTDYLKVFGRQGQKCLRPRCRGVIEKVKLAGRGTHFCSVCQK